MNSHNLIDASPEQLRFHTLRLGSRAKVARLYGVRDLEIYKRLPVVQFDHYRRGMMVNISGILCKKCLVCGTARELERFETHAQSRSGCRETCDVCRIRIAEEKQFSK